jgi:hypothetical protein
VLYYSDVPAPLGYIVASLPDDAASVTLGGNNYYYYQNTYYAQQPDGQYAVVAPPGAQTDAAAPAAAAAIDPKALDQVHRMADLLGSLKAGRFTIQDASDQILDSGEKIQVESTRKIAFRQPDRFAVDYAGQDMTRRTVYDGKTITMLETQQNLYAQEPMPPTLAQTMDTLANKYGMAVPAAELLQPGLFDKLNTQIQSAEYVAMESIAGQNCHHVALGLDWADIQLWVQDGDQPLPRKAVIIYKKIPGNPKYEMDISAWDLADPPDSVFAITIPPDAQKIDMAPAE